MTVSSVSWKSGRRAKLIAASVVLLLLFACMLPSARACTEVYVGCDASTDGSLIIARSNDTQSVKATRMEIVERVENVPGRTMPVNKAGTVMVEIPATTYRYTGTPWMSSVQAVDLEGKDDATCSNECGVTMSMSITAFSNRAVLEADPLVEEGISEFIADNLVICQSATAREAVEVLCGLIDRFGSSEINVATIADRDEAWLVEMYCGHQYAAVKLPPDMVAAFGNEFNLEYLSDYEDSIVSKDLESLAVENGFAVYSDDGELNLRKTYSGEETYADYSRLRTWMGHKLLAPDDYGDYDIMQNFPLVFRPAEKVSLSDVFEIMRNRYEGTEYSPEEFGREDVRVIGTDTAMSVHVVQLYPQYPKEMSIVTWVTMGPDVCGVFVPLPNCSTRIDESYNRDQSVEEGWVFNPEEYVWYDIKTLNAVGLIDYEAYGRPVRDYWAGCEEIMTGEMEKLLAEAASVYEKDPEKAAAMLTDYSCAVQRKSFEDAQSILRSQLWTLCYNSNTMKYGTNPETDEILSEKRELRKVEFELDNSGYRYVPEA